MGLVVVNIVSLIMFGLVIVMFVLADSIGGIAIGIGLSLIWLVFTIAAKEDGQRRSLRTVPGGTCLMPR